MKNQLTKEQMKNVFGGVVPPGGGGSTCTIQCAGGPPISYQTAGDCSVASRVVTLSGTMEQVQVGIVEDGQIVAGCTEDRPRVFYT